MRRVAAPLVLALLLAGCAVHPAPATPTVPATDTASMARTGRPSPAGLGPHWAADNVTLTDCSMVQAYLEANQDAVQAMLPDGYTAPSGLGVANGDPAMPLGELAFAFLSCAGSPEGPVRIAWLEANVLPPQGFPTIDDSGYGLIILASVHAQPWTAGKFAAWRQGTIVQEDWTLQSTELGAGGPFAATAGGVTVAGAFGPVGGGAEHVARYFGVANGTTWGAMDLGTSPPLHTEGGDATVAGTSFAGVSLPPASPLLAFRQTFAKLRLGGDTLDLLDDGGSVPSGP